MAFLDPLKPQAPEEDHEIILPRISVTETIELSIMKNLFERLKEYKVCLKITLRVLRIIYNNLYSHYY